MRTSNATVRKNTPASLRQPFSERQVSDQPAVRRCAHETADRAVDAGLFRHMVCRSVAHAVTKTDAYENVIRAAVAALS